MCLTDYGRNGDSGEPGNDGVNERFSGQFGSDVVPPDSVLAPLSLRVSLFFLEVHCKGKMKM